MMKKLCLPLIAVISMACGTVHGQDPAGFNVNDYVTIAPADLGLTGGPVDAQFDISSLLGLSTSGSVFMTVSNGDVNSTTTPDTWSVEDGTGDATKTTTFALSGTRRVRAYVRHGRNLGRQGGQDGIRTDFQSVWQSRNTTLDANYRQQNATELAANPQELFVQRTGATDPAGQNSENFVWTSDNTINSFRVFSTGAPGLDNNFSIGFQVEAVPEPSTGLLLIASAGMFFVRRKRRA